MSRFFFPIISLLIILFITSCSRPPLYVSKCEKFKKTSKEYLACMNEIVSSSNTALNIKEFSKHKTLSSFFKQVQVNQSD